MFVIPLLFSCTRSAWKKKKKCRQAARGFSFAIALSDSTIGGIIVLPSSIVSEGGPISSTSSLFS